MSTNNNIINTLRATLLIIFMLPSIGYSQAVYKLNEVDKAAEPFVGLPALFEYFNNNLQIPIASAAKGLNGRVFVQGIVELDGSMSEVKVVRALEPGADAEALRLFKLYKAWRPALKDGKAVRQEVIYPMIVRTEPVATYNDDEKTIIEYFDKKHEPTVDESTYKFRNLIPVDEYGHARADVLYQEFKGKNWKTQKTIPFTKEEQWTKLISDTGLDSVKSFRSMATDSDFDSSYEVVTRQENGQLLAFQVYRNRMGPPVFSKYYYRNGLLKEVQEVGEEVAITNWYENGMLQEKKILGKGGLKIMENWSKDGTALVTAGNGMAKISGNSEAGKQVAEEGKVVDGYKDGTWVSTGPDGTVLKEELYDKGKFVSGKIRKGTELVAFEEQSQTAGYKGGPTELYKFLGKNLNFGSYNLPANDKVIVTFIVATDGSLDDIKIEKSISALIDKEVLRVVNLSNGNWEPAIINGEKARVRYTLPINVQSK